MEVTVLGRANSTMLSKSKEKAKERKKTMLKEAPPSLTKNSYFVRYINDASQHFLPEMFFNRAVAWGESRLKDRVSRSYRPAASLSVGSWAELHLRPCADPGHMRRWSQANPQPRISAEAKGRRRCPRET